MSENSQRLNSVLNLLSLKRSVIPSGGGDRGKAPIVDWTEYQRRLPTEDELDHWCNNGLNPSLWGIITGQISGIVVFDADSPETVEIFHNAGLKPHVKTKRGEHFYFKHPGHLLKNKVGILPHIDLRGDGGFVNCLGTNENASYEMLIVPTDGSLYDLQQLPFEVKEAMLAQVKESTSSQPIVTEQGLLVKKGERNQKLVSLAGTLKNKNLNEEAIFKSLKAFYDTQCEHIPEITDKELLDIAKQSNKWQANNTNGKNTQASFHLTKLSDLLKEPDEDIAYLWENTLIKGGLSILVAKPKVGKSTLSRNLAYALAKGEPSFLGRNMTSSGPVVYLALEEKRTEVKKHFERMGATENLPIFIHTGSAPEQAIEELRKTIIESKALLAIIDPLQRLVRIPDLNDYSSVSLALEPLMQIARETNCHILLIHHANKGVAREGGDSILGSTAIFGSVDCALIMKRGESYRTIESIQRYGEDLSRTVLTFDVVTGLTGSGGSLEDVEVAECGKAILELLADHEMTEKEIKDGITDHKGGTVSKSLRLLCLEGKIQRQGLGKKGAPYQYATIKRNTGDAGDEHIEIPTIPTIPITGSSLKTDSLPKIGDTLNTPEAVLGMPVEKALEVWRVEGAPIIHLGDRENCEDLEKLLANPDVSQQQLEAVRTWLDKILKRSGKSC